MYIFSMIALMTIDMSVVRSLQFQFCVHYVYAVQNNYFVHFFHIQILRNNGILSIKDDTPEGLLVNGNID